MNKPREPLALDRISSSGLRQRLAESVLLQDGHLLAVWALHDGERAVVLGLEAQLLDRAGAALSAAVALPTAGLAAPLQVQVSGLAEGGALVAWGGLAEVEAAVLADNFGAASVIATGLPWGPDLSLEMAPGADGRPELTVHGAQARVGAWTYGADAKLARPEAQESYGLQPEPATGDVQATPGTPARPDRAAELEPASPMSAGPAATPLAWGEERVNTYVASNQTEPEVAVLSDGSYVVTWQSSGQDGSGDGVFAQRFASNGRAFGPEWRVNANTTNTQEYPHIAALSDGGFVVVWQDNNGTDGSGWAVMAQRYNAQGVAQGANFVVNTTTSGGQYHGVVAAYSGGFAVAWGADSSDVHLKRYDNNGAVTLAETLISSAGNTSTGQSGTQYLPSIAARADGSLVIVWEDLSGNDTSGRGVYGRTVAANNALAAPFVVSTTVAGSQYEPSVSMLSDGGFVVVWRSDSQDGSGAGVFGQRFNAAGSKVGSEFLVNTTTSSNQYLPSVTGQSTGGFTVAWYSDASNTGTSADVFIQEYDALGAAIGSERKLVSASNSTEYQPSIADLGNGNLVVVYADYRPGSQGGNDTYDIQQQIFGSGAAVARSGTPELGDFVGSVTFGENLVNATPQVIDAAVSVTNTGSSSFDGGRLDLYYVQGGQATDQLGVRDVGNAFGQIGVAGATVSFGGTAIGTISGGANGGNLLITFNAAATTDAVEALVQNLTYASSSQSPGATRTVGLRISDGDGGSSAPSTFTINVTPELDGVPVAHAEERVNAYTASTQETPDIAVLVDGSYVITWASYSQDDVNNYGVYFQRFAANGTPLGPEVRANSQVDFVQEYPHVAALSNGGFVLVWQDNSGLDTSGWSTVAQRYDAQGQAVGANFIVNTTTSSNQYHGVVAGYSGGFAVAWAADNSSDVHLKRYDNNGVQTLGETLISTQVGNPAAAMPGTQYLPSIAARTDGSLVIAWHDTGGSDGSASGVFVRTVAANNALGTPVQVNTFTTGNQYEPQVATLSTGGFVVVWRSDSQDGSSAGVYAQRFDAAGAKVGGEFLVNETTAGGQYQPAVTATLAGGFVVSWYNDNFDISGAGTSADVYIREFDAAGQPVDGQRKLASPSNSTEYQPAIEHLGNGNFVVAYTDYANSASGGNDTWEIVHQVFGSGATVARQANPTVGDFTGSVTFGENLVNTAPQVIDASVSISDADSANFAGGRLDLFYVQYGEASDQLGVRNQGTAAGQIGVSGNTVSYGGTTIGTISGGANGSNLVITFAAAATVDAVEALVQNLTYASTSQSPSLLRTVGLRISDGDGGSSTSSTVSIQVARELDGVPVAHGEEQVNTYTNSNQWTPDVAVLADGSYVVTWASYSQDDSNSYGVYFQRHAANGTPLGPEVRANTNVNGTQEAPSVAALGSGGFVVVWGDNTGLDGSGWATVAQRYDAQGLAQGANFIVNTHTNSTQYQGAVAGYASGFAVVWSSTSNSGGNGHDIYLKRYDNSGAQTLAETRISTAVGAPATAQTGGQHEPDVAARSDGSLVIVWEDQSGNDGSAYGVYMRTVSAAGVLGATVQVNTYTTSNQYEAKVAAFEGGGSVVVWRSSGQDGSSEGVYGQRFDAAGNKVGAEFLVNESTNGGQYQPDVAATTSGGFVVTWYSDNFDVGGTGTTQDVYVREFNAAGQPVDGQRKLVSPSNSSESEPAVAHLGNGNFVVVYTDYNNEPVNGTNSYEVMQQVLGTGAAVARQANPTVGDFTGSVTFGENLVNAAPQVIDTSVSVSDLDSANFAGGRLDLFYVQSGEAADQLGVRDQGNAAGQIGVAGSTVSFGGTPIGTLSGGSNGSNLSITFTAAATVDAVEALVQNLTYAHTSQSPGATRTVGLRLSDGDGGASAASTFTISVTPEVDGAPLSHGPERVNSYAESTQGNPRVATLANGSYVVTWESSGQDGAGDGSYFQRFAPNGVALGLEQRVNSAAAGSQSTPQVARLSDGGFVIAFTDTGGFDGSGSGVVAQRYDVNGVAQGANFVVNSHTSSTQQLVSLASYTSGFAAVWSSAGNAGGNGFDIYLRRFDNAGVQTLAETRISTIPGNPANAQTSNQSAPAIAARADGSLVIVWEDQGGNDGSSYGVYARTVSSAGVLSDTFLVNTTTANLQYEARVATLTNRDFVVVWRAEAQDGSGAGVYGQRFNEAGVKQGAEFLINESTNGGQYQPDIAALDTGGFVVTWYNDNFDATGAGTQNDVYVREYSAAGVAVDGQRKLASPTNSTEYQPAVADLGGGKFVVVYADYDNSNSGSPGNNTYEVVQQIFGSGASLARGANPAIADLTGLRLLSSAATSPLFAGNPQVIDADVSVTDADSTNFDSGVLSITLANGATPTETLAVRNQGNALGQIGVAGATVSYGGVAIGTITGGTAGASDLLVSLNSNATAAAVRALVENITYRNTSPPGGTTDRYINVRLTDGDGGASLPQSVQLRIQASVAPAAVALDDIVAEITITESQANAGVLVDDAVQLVYSGSGSFNNGKLTVSYVSSTGRAADQLAILNEGNGNAQVGVSGSTISYGGVAIGSVSATLNGSNGSSLEVTFNASASDQAVERVIERLQYSNNSSDPNDTRTLRIQVTDSAGATSTARNVEVNVQGQADPAAAVALTPDLQANTLQTGQQEDSSLARLLGPNNGGYVIAWHSQSALDGDGYSVHAQRFNANGQAAGPESIVNSHTLGNQYEVAVTGLANGGFVVAWRSDSQDGSGTGVYAQRFDANGQAAGTEFRVNTVTISNQHQPAIQALSDGTFVAVYYSEYNTAGNSNTQDVLAQRFAADGSRLGAELTVNTNISSTQAAPKLAQLGTGYVVVWHDASGSDGSGYGIKAQRMAADGTKLGGEISVNTTFSGNQLGPDVVQLAGGGFVVVWEDANTAKAQRLDAAGAKVGGEILVSNSDAPANYSDYVRVAALETGGFVVAWDSIASLGGSGYDVLAQQFNAAGNRVDGVFFLNSNLGNTQISPDVVGLAGGNFVASWSSYDQEREVDNTYGIFHRVFGTAGSIAVSAPPVLVDLSSSVTFDENLVNSTQQLVDANVGLSDADSANFDGGRLWVSVVSSYPNSSNDSLEIDRRLQDQLSIGNQGNAAGQVGVAGNTVSYGGLPIGTIEINGANGADLVVLFNANASTTAVEAVIENLRYGNSSSAPGAVRDVSVTLSDGDGGTSQAKLVRINVAPQADGPQPLFGNEVVNTYRTSTQDEPSAAALSDGSYVIVWASEGQDGSSTGIYGQRFAANGERLGPEFDINTHTLGTQTSPAVAALAGGGFVVTWQSQGQDGSGWGTYAQRFANDGTAQGAEFLVNTTTGQSQYQPVVTGTADGGFVIAWYYDWYNATSTELGDIYFQRYNAAGVAQGSETQATPAGLGTQYQYEPAMAGLAGGGFVILWRDDRGDGAGNGTAVNGRIFNASGVAVGNAFQVNTYLPGNQYQPDVAALSGGGFVATWYSDSQDGNSGGVYAQRFDASGNKLGNEFRVHIDTAGNQTNPSVAALAGGGFAISYLDGNRMFVQQFAADGSRVDGETLVDTHDNLGNAGLGDVVGLASGGLVVAWRDYNYGNATYEVFQQILGNPDTLTRQARPVLADVALEVTFDENLVNATPQLIDSSIDVSDADSANFGGGTLWVSVASGYGDISYAQLPQTVRSQDQLGVRNEGNGVGQVGVAGSNISVGGVLIGTITSNGSNGSDLVVSLNANATVDAVEALLENLTYGNSSSAPVGSRQVSISLSDGDGGTSEPRLVTINVTSQADGGQPLFGNEVVNTYEPGTQGASAVAALADGGYVVTWVSAGQDGWGSAVHAQRYDANGVARGSEFKVNTYTPYDQDQPSVAALSGGGYVIVWTSANQDGVGDGIFGQRFDVNGVPQGGEFLVNSGNGNSQSQPDVAALPGGGFVATWYSDFQDGEYYNIRAQRFDVSGAKVGAEIDVEQIGTNDFDFRDSPAVASFADGSMVIVWRSDDVDGQGAGIAARRFGADGAATGTAFRVNSYITGNQYEPDVAALAGGGFVVVWRSDGQDGSGGGVFGQRYAADGSAVGSEFRVNFDTSGNQTSPSVTALPGGGFVVSYEDSNRMAVQQFAADGTLVDNEIRVDTQDTTGNASEPAIAALANGSFVVTWTDYDYNINNYQVYQQFFGNPAVTTRQANPELVDVASSVTLRENTINAVPQLLDPGVGLFDADSANFDGGVLEVNYITGYGAQDQLGQQGLSAQDQLGIRNEGNGPGQVGVAGNTVSYSGVAIGSIVSAGANGAKLTVQFNANATVDAVEQVIEALTYANTVSNPIASRTVSIRVTDGDGGASAARSLTINVTPEIDGAVRFGQERTVNSTVAGNQVEPEITRLADGGYVVVWEDQGGADGSSYGVYGQRYDANDNPAGTQFRANTTTSNAQYEPQVQALTGGGYVVVWRSDGGQDGSAAGVYAQRYNSDGTAAGSEFRVNTFTNGNQYQPTIAATLDGGFIVAWLNGEYSAGFAEYSDIFFQRYNASGVAQGAETRANPVLGSTFLYQSEPSIAVLASGSFVIVWTDNTLDGSGNGVYGQLFSAVGTAQGSAFRVNSYTTSNQDVAKVAALKGGGFVVVWTSTGQDLSGEGVYAQRYDAAGAAVGAEFRVNTSISGGQYDVDIAALENGGWVVTWYSDDGQDVYLQQYNSAGLEVDGETRVNTYTYSTQSGAAVVSMADGGFVVTWSSQVASFDGNGDGQPDGGNDSREIRLQRFSNTAPQVADVSVSGLEEQPLTLTAALFESGFNDADGQSLQAIKVLTLPASGTLRLDGVPVLPEQEITLAQLQANGLTYTGSIDFFGTDQFRWTGSDGVAFASTPVLTNISLSNVNDGPRLEAGANDGANEGNFYSHGITINDPDPEGHRVTVNWGDGTAPQVYNFGNSPNHSISHVYADNGSYNVSVTADDQRGQANSVETDSFTVTVANVVPTLALFGNPNTVQGEVYTLTLGGVNDPGADTVTEYRIDWGDGSGVQVIPASALPASRQVQHTYAAQGNRNISVALVDEDGSFADAGSKAITVAGPAEVITVDAGADTTVSEGSNFNRLVTFTDPSDQAPAGRTYTVDWGDGSASSGFLVAGQLSFNISHAYADDGQTFTVLVTVDDSGAQQGSDSFTVGVQNVAPTLVLGGAGSVNEGAAYVMTLDVNEPGADTITQYQINWGDGSAVQTVLAADLPANRQVSHVYADGDANRSINVTVVDEDGTWVNAGQRNVFVNNVGPTAPVTGADTVGEGSAYTLNVGVVVDPGQDTRTLYTINWGDGSSETFTVAQWAAASGVFTHTYVDGTQGGTARSIVVSATDEDGSFTLGVKNITVTNVAPGLSLGGAASTTEGASYVLNVVGTDPAGASDNLSYTINWGDGSADQVLTAAQLAALAGNVAHVFDDDEDGPVNSTPRTISVTVNDGEGGVNTQTRNVAVNNVAPVVALSGAATVQSGQTYTLNLGAITDPGTDTVSSYVIDWGDGNTQTVNAGGNVTHTYTSAGARVITVDLVDEDGTFTDVASLNVDVQAPTPTLNLEAGADAIVNEGQALVRNINFTDGQDNDAPGWSYTIDYGDGTVDSGTTLSPGLALNHVYADGNAIRTVTVTVTDGVGETVSDAFQVTVNNVAPQLAINGAGSTDEGASFLLNIAGSDAAGASDPLVYTISWGDGSANQVLTATQLAALGGNVPHVFADDEDGPVNSTARNISVTVVDGDGGSTTQSRSVNVNNVAPVVALSGAASVQVGQTYTLNLGAITDPGTDAVTSYIIDWGDGSTQTVNAGGNVTHTYASTGARVISVDLVDEDGTYTDVATVNVDVQAATPTVNVEAGPDASVNEGQAFTRTVNFGDGQDDGAAGWTYSINYGDGTVDTGTTLTQSLALDHVYADGGNNYTVTVTVTDVLGESSSDSFAVVVNNVAPAAAVTGPDTVDEGNAYLLNVAAVADPGADTRTGYSINWGDGSSDTYTPAQWALAAGSFSHTYADGGNGGTAFTITVSTVDEDGSFVLGSKGITVNNVAPQLAINGAGISLEGASYVLNIVGGDAAGASDPLVYTINWGDGSAEQVLTAAQLAALGGNVGHVFADDEDGPVNSTARTVSVSVVDGDGASTTQSRAVSVNNVDPVATLSGASSVGVGQLYTLSLAGITDPGTDTVSSYRINWGDGSSDNRSGNSGSVTHTYAATGNFTITIDLVDEDGGFANAGSLALVVNPPGNQAPVADDESYSMRPGQTLTITAPGVLEGDTDADGDPLNVTSVNITGLQGVLNAQVDGGFTFTPTAGFVGSTSFTYSVSDGFGGFDSGLVTINVTNAAPVADDESYSMRPGQTLTITAPGVLEGDTDADGDPLNVTSVNITGLQGVLTAQVDGGFTFTPTAGFVGSTSFTYSVSDGFGGFDSGLVTINVTNAAPVADDESYSMRPGQTLTITAPGVLEGDTDADGDPLSVTSVNITGLQGVLNAQVDGGFTFTPTAGFVGSTSFTYSVSDGFGGFDSGLVTINVINAAPVADDESYSMRPGQTLTITAPGVLEGDTDPDGDPLSVTSVNITGLQGVLNAQVDGSFTFTPTAGFVGSTSFTYVVSDGLGGFDSGLVTIDVQAQDVTTLRIGDAPVRQSGGGGQWATAWTHPDVAIQHKADAGNAAETFSAVRFDGVQTSLLAGGDVYGGDLGVSGQSAASSAIRQEIDGKEVLRFNLAREATEVTVNLSQFFVNDDGTVHAEAGRLRLLDGAGTVVAETVFTASNASGQQQVSLGAAAGFVAMELSAGSIGATEFVFGAYAGGQAPFVDATGAHGSDFLVDWVEFDFPVVAIAGVPPQDPL